MAEGLLAIQRVTLRELAPRQRRELGSIMASGVASSALFLMAFLQAIEPAPLASTPVAVQVVAVAESPRGFAPAPAVAIHRRAVRATPARRYGTVMALASVTAIPQSGARVGSWKPTRRLSRLLLGDGRYRVQPFPAPANESVSIPSAIPAGVATQRETTPAAR